MRERHPPSPGLPAAAGEALAVDAASRPRQRLKPAGGDLAATPNARSEAARIETGKCLLDEGQLLLRAIPEGEITLLGEDLAGGRGLRSIRHLAGRYDGLADLVEQAPTLSQKRGADRIVVGGRHRRDGT